MEKWIFAGLFLSLIVLDAVGDGLRDRKLKKVAGFFEFLLLFLLLGSMLFFQTLYWPVTLWPDQCVLLLLAYMFLRYALFEIIYNIVSGNILIFSVRNTTTFERIHNRLINWILFKSWFGKLFNIPGDYFLLFIKTFFLVVGFKLIKWSF